MSRPSVPFSIALLATIAMSAAALLPNLSFANVSLKNGNFFIGYTDIDYPGGFEPKIERVYNSKTPFNGIFGWGWGNEYEVKLSVSADGSVVISEYGGGAQNRFAPDSFDAKALDAAVENIATAARKTGGLGSAEQLDAYKKKLKGDASFRNSEWNNYLAQGKIQPRQLPAGTKLHSNRFAYQMVTVNAGGTYTRTFDNGRVENFDNLGNLLKISDKNGNFIAISYNKERLPEKIQDNFNRKMFLSYTRAGKVEKIQGENGKTADYRYNDQGELTYSKDTDGNVYTFKYSSDKRHNLTEIGYDDKTTMQVSYYPQSQLENVKTVKDRDGTLTEYTYGKVNGEKDSIKVGVVVKTSSGQSVSTSQYDYVFRTKASGESWTYKMVSNLDGILTETTYNECCGLPLIIKRGDDETTFAYDTAGRVTKKTSANEITELSYDKSVGKVNRVVNYSKKTKKADHWSTFQYDPKGNLVFAKNSEKRGVRLFYDLQGRIKTMVDQDKRRIDFKYNENSKPVEITDPALGSITVQYTNSGEVKKVDSTAGRKIALQVTSAFQNLLEIIRPAGVTLSF